MDEIGCERGRFIRIPLWWRTDRGRTCSPGQVPQVGGVALTCCGNIVRIPGAQLNPLLESDSMGICNLQHLHMLLSKPSHTLTDCKHITFFFKVYVFYFDLIKECRLPHLQTAIILLEYFSKRVWKMAHCCCNCSISTLLIKVCVSRENSRYLCLTGMYRKYAGSLSTHPEILVDLYST